MICRTIIILFSLHLIVFCSCNENKAETSLRKEPGIQPPIVVTAGAPKIISLDTCPTAEEITVPVNRSVDRIPNTSTGTLNKQLTPPVVKPADFFLPMSNYNDEKGLGLNSIMSSFCDRDGNLWFGTNGGGLTKYNGKTSVTFTAAQGLGNNQPRCITQDKDGNIWFVMGGGGVAKYDGRYFTAFSTTNGLPSNEVRAVTVDKKGNLWFGTEYDGISYYNGRTFRNYTTKDGLGGNAIQCSIQDRNGNLWFGTVGNGVSCFDGSKFVNYNTGNGLVNDTVRSIAEDRNGNIWIGANRGVSKFDGKSFKNYTPKDGLANHTIHSIVEDDAGNLWFGTYGGGVNCFDGKKITTISTKQGLSNDIVRSIVKDKQGNLWFGTFGGGVDCYTGKSIINYTDAQGLPQLKVWAITEDGGENLWFGTDSKGICKYDGKNFYHFNSSQGLCSNNILSLLWDKKHRLWVGTYNGVSCYNGKSFTNYSIKQGLAHLEVHDITEDKHGDIWFGTYRGGVSKFDGKKFINLNKSQGLAGNDVRSILEDDEGRFWFGTFGGGLSCYDGKAFINFTNKQGLTSDFIFELVKDRKGNLWIATANSGVSILPKKYLDNLEKLKAKSSEKIFVNLTTNEGLANNSVYGMVEDKEGNIIMGTNLGITVIKGGLKAGSSIVEKTKIENYNLQTGYPVKDANANAVFMDSKGIIWVGTGQKLVRFDYAAIKKNHSPPKLNIGKIKINNENISWYNLLSHRLSEEDTAKRKQYERSLTVEEAMLYSNVQTKELRDSMGRKFEDIRFDSITPFYPLPVTLELPYKHNNVTFDFVAVEPVRPSQLRYQYTLEGYDKEWSPVTDQSTASFGNIYEGKYTFKVKAMSPDGVWSKPVSFSFTVLPPYWRSWWFRLIYITALLALAAFVIAWRVRVFRNNEKKKLVHQKELLEMEARALRAQMNPHFIFNCLNSIKALMQQNETEKGITYLTTFSKLIRTVFNNSDKRQISLYDEIETCKLYTQLEAMRLNGKLKYNFNLDSNLDLKSVMVPALIIQPFIENAIWHGIVPKNEGNIVVSVYGNDDTVTCEVDDDGIGRETSKLNKPVTPVIHESKGVHLSQQRLNLEKNLNDTTASIEIIDKYEKSVATGTKVILSFKLN